MFQQRNLIGVVAVGCILFSCYLLFFGGGDNYGLSGILMKVGLMLSAIWLALPSLLQAENQNSLFFLAALFALIVLAAARPKIFFMVIAVAIVAFAINWMLKRLGRDSG